MIATAALEEEELNQTSILRNPSLAGYSHT